MTENSNLKDDLLAAAQTYHELPKNVKVQTGQVYIKLSVQESARRFYESYGMPIIPVGSDKHPTIDWKQFQNHPMTSEQFDCLPWDTAANFAVVCGTLTKSSYYFVAIDVDKEIKVQPRTTMMEETPRGGRHHYYLTKTNCKGVKLHDVGIELLAAGQIVIVYGKWLNDNLPTPVDSIEADFKELAKAHGKTELTRARQPLAEVLQPQPEGNRDKSIFDLVGALRDKNVPYETALATALATNDKYMPPLDEKTVIEKVQNAYKHLYQKPEQPAANTTPADTDLPKTHDEFILKLKALAALDVPLTVDDLSDILDSSVKHDKTNKVISFVCMTLTYTEEDQVNLGFLAESSTGKSYIPLELAWYFPKEDVIKLGYASPTSFFHDWGTLVVDPSDTRDVEDEKKRKITHIDLHQKILIFMDQPHDQLLQRLRSLLSHDEKEIVVKIADRKEKSGLRTKTIIIHGYPTVMFCTANRTMQDQEKTRLMLLSPEVSQEKLQDTITLKIDRESDREAYYKRMMEDPRRSALAGRISDIKMAHIQHVKVPEDLREKIRRNFLEGRKFLIPRHQRDISRLLAIIKGHALLNFKFRERIEDNIFVNDEDVIAGFALYHEISEANELGLSPELFSIYQKLKPHMEQNECGITMKEFQKAYYQEFHKVVGGKTAKAILEPLMNVGLIIEQPDPTDKRFLRYIPTDMGTPSEDESITEPRRRNYIPPHMGTTSEKYIPTDMGTTTSERYIPPHMGTTFEENTMEEGRKEKEITENISNKGQYIPPSEGVYSSTRIVALQIPKWISSHKDDDGLIDVISFEAFLKGSGESDPSKLIEILKRDGVLFPVSKVGKLGVVR
jgi:hypothetical protein